MGMGQGLMYGFGFLYDDGGDDDYRSIWWAPAGGVHMGVGVLLERAGNDTVMPIVHGGGLGTDSGVAWMIDLAGNDRYGGAMEYGRAAGTGMSFFVNVGGDDVYNADGVLPDAAFGWSQDGSGDHHSIGAFLDLGGGKDVYQTSAPNVRNDASWTTPLVGKGNPAAQKGFGIDR
jgi:hypothetical protein